jgi:hypothetical protein
MPVSDAIDELVHHGSHPRPMKQIVAIAEANHRRKDGGIADAKKYALGGVMQDPYMERMEMRAAMNETGQYHPGGFIASDTAGRTDRLPMSVVADSFVMPADVVSGLGQGNSLAGPRMLNEIIGSPAPNGAGAAPRGRGAKLPQAPRGQNNNGPSQQQMTGLSSALGSALSPNNSIAAARNSDPTYTGPSQPAYTAEAPVGATDLSGLDTSIPDLSFSRGGREPLSDVIVAGGEHIIPREDVERVGHRMRAAGKSKAKTDLEAGHAALRDLVDRVRKYQMKFLKTAPKPKK